MEYGLYQRQYAIHDVAEYINWLYFYHAWEFPPRFSTIAKVHGCDVCKASWLNTFPTEEVGKAAEAMQLFKEAGRMLELLDRDYHVHCIVRLCHANSDGDDLLLDNVHFPLLRQQTEGSSFLSLCDFVRPLSSHVTDTVGVFAATVDGEMEELFENDIYKRMLVKTLCDRLAEAATEKLHEEVRKNIWGYAKDEKLTIDEMLEDKFQGIRPAVGYPSLPDQSVNFVIDQLLGFSHIGIRLTETGMMIPHASVSGLMFALPQAQYFAIGKISEEQLANYAARRGMKVDDIRKFLSRNL